MKKFIILFRGINVGGNNLLPMKALVPLLKQHNFQDVLSYIQSGNVVLTSTDDPTDDIKEIVFANFDFSPELFVLDDMSFLTALHSNPFTGFEGKFVHFYFCHHPIVLNQDKVDKYRISSEEYIVKDNVFYLHAPDGIGRSKLVANIEACLGQAGTGRNLNTVNKVSQMLTS